MLGIIKDYLLTVLVRMIVGYIVFLSIATIAFLGNALIFNWSDAIAFTSRLASNEIVSLVVWLPFALAWFRDDRKGSMPTDYMSFATKQLLGFYK
jgi:hypothetical protein